MIAFVFYRNRLTRKTGPVCKTTTFGRWEMDRYTKCILTVIAAALVTIAAQNVIGSATAQSHNVERVTLCTDDGTTCGFGANRGMH
jgi:hypothetical protein